MPDLFAALPPLKRSGHTLLAGQIALLGVSAVVYDDEAFYFEVNRPHYWGQRADGTISVGVGGVGGSLKEGEDVLAGLRREVQEELGVDFRLEVPPRTALVHGWEVVDWLDLPPHRKYPTPYIVNLLPPRLGGPGTPDHLAIVTLLGRPRGQPRRGDLFGVLAVEHQALETFFSLPEWPLAEALSNSGLSLDLAEDLPAGCVLRPVLTARAFQLLVRRGAAPPV